MSLRCRMGLHRFDGPGEMVRDDLLAQGHGGVVVLEAGYFRYRCARCGVTNDTARAVREEGQGHG